MRRLLILSIFLLAFLFGSAYGQKANTSDPIRITNPINSGFGLVDSVVIEYLDNVDAIQHIITFNRDSINVTSTSPYNPARMVNDKDTVKMLIGYVKNLFILGKEKSVINITYGALLDFGPTDNIKIRLFRNKTNYYTHDIFLARSNGKIEFSRKFNSFIKFFRSLIKYNQ